ncbi:MAG: hypothetical protein ABJZ55_24110 [Fuerstiella sp.]
MKRLPAAALLLFVCTGCQGLLHELQPHRLWRVNYQDPIGRTDGVYFSVDDPLDVPVPKSELTAPEPRAPELTDAN